MSLEQREVSYRNRLSEYLNLREANNPNSNNLISKALEIYDNSLLKNQVMPHPAFRFALAACVGTPDEIYIQNYLDGTFAGVVFATPSNPDVLAQTQLLPDGRRKTFYNKLLEFNAPEFWINLMGHEARHPILSVNGSVPPLGREEEVCVANGGELVMMKVLLAKPSLLGTGTPSKFERNELTSLFAKVQSGRADYPNTGILSFSDASVYPGGKDIKSFADFFSGLPSGFRPTNKQFIDYVKGLVPLGVTVPEYSDFRDYVPFLDRYQNQITPEQLVKVAGILGLRLSTDAEKPMLQQFTQSLSTVSSSEDHNPLHGETSWVEQ